MSKSIKLFAILSATIFLSWCTIFKKEVVMDHSNMTSEEMMHMDHTWDTTPSSWLSTSPRHQERVEINNSGKIIYTRVVYPQVSKPAPVVLVIHENKWLTDWARQMADDIAAQWYIAIAPDLLSSFSGDKKRTTDFASEDEATKALYTLSPETVMSDLKAVQAYADTITSSNGKTASVWFCWGGSQSFRYATASSGLDHAFVFYGSAPEDTNTFKNITAPVTAYYGWDDVRINGTIEKTEKWMQQYNKPYTYEIYAGAWHAFMRNALNPDASQANKDARTRAFQDMLVKLQSLNK